MQSVFCVVLLSAFRPARWVICPEWVELKKSENDAENKLFSLGSELAYLARISSFINSAQKLNELPEKAHQFAG